MFETVWNRSIRLRKIASNTLLIKVDETCKICRIGPFCVRHRSFCLVGKDQLDEPLWLNPYVHYGYRPAEMPLFLCFMSLFQLNNESINVWSHLLGLVYFTFSQLYINIVYLPTKGAILSDYLLFTMAALCFQMCMLLSASYHLLGCRSPQQRRYWLSLDMLGISAGVVGIYLSGLYFAFYCFPLWLRIYLSLLALVSVTIVLASQHRHYMTNQFCGQRLGYYHLVYSTVVLLGLIPTGHWVYLEGGLAAEHVIRFLPTVLVSYGFTGLGFVFYIFMIPERWHPGHFDFFGWSHQWWHLFILFAIIWWRNAGFNLFEYHQETPDACFKSTKFNG